MEIVRSASAGTMESSDAYVEIEPAQTLQIQLESVVSQQFGDAIKQGVTEVLQAQGVENARIFPRVLPFFFGGFKIVSHFVYILLGFLTS